ncbi:autotransporter-associated beta strand repeat-containing protein, partial [Aquabacter spiritensis]
MSNREAPRRTDVARSMEAGRPSLTARRLLRRRLLLTSALVSTLGLASPAFSQALDPNGVAGQDGFALLSTGAGGGGGGGGVGLIGAASGTGSTIEGGAGGAGGIAGRLLPPAPTGGNAGQNGTVNGNPGAGTGGSGGAIAATTFGAGGAGGGGAAGGAAAGGSGDISGGGGGGGGAAIILNTAGTYSYNDQVTGGAGGAGGDVTAAFSGNVLSGNGGNGGAGLLIHLGATDVTSAFTIVGGAGGNAGNITSGTGTQGTGGVGGAGVVLSADGSSFGNLASGTVTGGVGGSVVDAVLRNGFAGAGGAGVLLSGNTSTVTNSGTLRGGEGGYRYDAGRGASGAGLLISGSNNTITNESGGFIYGADTTIGAGGIGVIITGSGNTLISAGTITSGSNSNGEGESGIRVDGNNNTVIISGLVSSIADTLDAIRFIGTGNTLEIRSGWALGDNNTGVASGNGGTFALGGTVDATINMQTIVGGQYVAQQFNNFSTFEKVGTSTWTLISSSGGSGSSDWTVKAGTLFLDGSQFAENYGSIVVESGAVLRANGAAVIHGNVTLNGTADFEAKAGPGNYPTNPGVRVSSLTLAPTSTLTITLGDNPLAPAIEVLNLATFNGAEVNIVNDGNLAAGTTYTLLSLAGGNSGTLTLGDMPAGFSGTIYIANGSGMYASSVFYFLDVVAASAGLYWNGGVTTSGGSSVVGGDGTWSAGNTNWTNSAGATAVAWDGSTAIFAGTSSSNNVTVVGAPGVISVEGMQFDVDGYNISGDSITLAATSGQTGIDVATSVTATIGSVLVGTTGLEKTGDGVLILSGANTYAGGTTITGGTLQIGAGGATGSVDGDIANDAALVVNRTGALTLSGIISGSGTLEKLGTGTLTLTGANTYTGTTTVSAGTLRIGDGTAAAGEIAGNITNNAALVFDRPGALTYTGNISGSGTLTKQGGGTLTLSGALSYTGATTIASGNTLELTSIGTYTLAGAVSNDGSLVVNNVAGARVYISDVISGNGTLTKSGGAGGLVAGLVLTGNNTFSGGTTINANGIDVGNNTTTGDIGDVTFTAANTFLAFYRSNDYTYDSVVSGAGSVVKGGAGTTTFTGENTYTGGTRVALGTLIVGDGATNGWIAGDVQILSGATLVFDRSDAKTFSGIIFDAGSLEKQGTGTLTLTGANTYTGTTTVSAGTLEFSNAAGLGSTAFGTTVASGATLRTTLVDPSATIAENFTLSGSGATGERGALVNTGRIILSGGIQLDADATISSDYLLGRRLTLSGIMTGNGTLTLDGGGIMSGPILTTTGGLTKTGDGTWSLQASNGYIGVTTVSDGALSVENNGALGGTTSGTVVESGGTLMLFNSRAITGEALTLAGEGYEIGYGALTASGVNSTSSWAGAITLSADASIVAGSQFDSGVTLDLTGGIITAGFTARLGGSNTGTVSSDISGTGGVTKFGEGTWILSVANTYSGATTVSGGTLRVTDNAGLGTIAGGVTVASGATLDLRNAVTNVVIGAETLALSGTGVSGGGALQSTGGFNSWAGAITLDADSLIVVTDNQLTLSGGITAVDKNLTLGGAANGSVSSSIATGAGTLTKTGSGSWDLTAANSYAGLTTVSAGQLRIANATALGTTASGTVVASGATLALGGSIAVGSEDLTLSGTGIVDGGGASQGALVSYGGTNSFAGAITLAADSTINTHTYSALGSLTLSGGITGAGTKLTLGGLGAGTVSGVIAIGAGTVTKVDAGSWTLSGANTYTGATLVSAGTLTVAHATGLGTAAGGTTVAAGASLVLSGGVAIGAEALSLSGSGLAGEGVLVSAAGANSFAGAITLAADSVIGSVSALTLSGVISGGSALEKIGAETLTLTGANTYTGGTTVSGGTLSIGAGGAIGSITGDVVLSTGTLAFNRSDDISFADVVSGTGALNKLGAGKLTLTNDNTFDGTTTVSGGTLELSGGSLAGGVSVETGATLKGGASAGTVSGDVAIAAGATLVGVSGATSLSIGGNLTFADPTSIFAVTLGSPSPTTPAINVGGDLVLTGVLNLTTGVGFASGTYRLIDYAGTLSGAGLEIGTAPEHSLIVVSTATANQVNLMVAAGQWWNGSNTTGGSSVAGGTGTWNVQAGTTNWTSSDGSAADAWGQGGLAIFAGTAGTVTVGGTTNPQVAGLEFVTSGYVLESAVPARTIQLVPVADGYVPEIAVGAGEATISVALGGGFGFEKTGEGTLILTRSNSIEGEATVSAGTLQFSGDASVAGSILVKSGASFVAESGATGGSVLGMTLESGATLQMEADGVSSLTVGSLLMQGATVINLGLGAPSTTAALSTGNGDLVLSGTLNLIQRDGYASGTYRLFDFGGQITNTGLVLGSTEPYSLNVLDYSTSGQVNLLVAAAQWWNGSTIVPGTSVQGGDGTWTVASDTNWTNATGTTAKAWTQGSIAIFAGTAGTVTLSGATDPEVAGMHFLTSGYTLTGGEISLVSFNGQTPVITVGDATPATAGVTGTIASALGGTAGLEKAGAGTLTLTGNNAITGTTVVSAGSLVFAGGTSTAGGFTIGRDVATSGAATLTGAATSLDLGTSNLMIVADKGTGEFTIAAGAVLTSGEGYVGYDTGAVGHATVTGIDSRWDVTNSLYVGYYGTGTMEISGGASVTAAYAVIGYYDDNSGATGTLTITGPGSSLDLGTGEFDVGYYNGGSVTVSNGATLTTGVAYIGVYSGSVGTYNSSVTVTGEGSTWNLNGQDLYLGYYEDNTSGTLVVSDGGKVESGAVWLGYYDISRGSVTVTGAESMLDSGSNDFYAGYYGDGTITVAAGGTILSGDLYLGNNTGRSGTLTVTGAGSSFDAGTHTVYLGQYSSNGSITLGTGGALVAGRIEKDASASTGVINLDGGILRAGATQSDFLSGFAAGDITLAAGGGKIDTNGFDIGVSSILGGNGTLEKTGAGTLTLSAANTYSGDTTVTAGTLRIADAGALGTSAAGTTVASGATLEIFGSGPLALGAEALTLSGTGVNG